MGRWCCPIAGPHDGGFCKQGIMGVLHSLDSVPHGEATVAKGSKDTWIIPGTQAKCGAKKVTMSYCIQPGSGKLVIN